MNAMQVTRFWFTLGIAVLCLVLATDGALAQQTPTQPGSQGPSLGSGLDDDGRDTGRSDARASTRSRRGQSGNEVSVVRGIDHGTTSRVLSAIDEGFNPIMLKPIVYGPVPAVDDKVAISLTGPMLATEFLDALSLATGWNIAATQKVQELTLQFWTNKVSPRQAVSILKFNEIYYEYSEEDEFLFVMMQDEYLEREYGSLSEYEFTLRHADLLDVEIVLASFLSSRGRLIADPATSKILVLDTVDNIRYMKNLVSEMEVPRLSETFTLAHVDAEILVSSIEALLTEGGQLNVDPRSNTLIVTDRPERVARIADIVANLDQELGMRTWVLDYADPVEIANNIALLVPDAMGSIVVNEAIHQITVTATPFRLSEIAQRIQGWDTRRQQVQIEAYLATASSNTLRDLGINWTALGTIDGDPFAVEVGSPPPAPTGGGAGELVLGALTGSTSVSFLSSDFAAVIDALDTSTDATILAHPRITVQDGQEALFENTTQVPFASSTTTFGSSNNDTINSNTQIEFIDVGTILRVTPRITSDQNVLLDIAAEDSSFVSVVILANGQENTMPQKTQNKAQTQVLVRSGETIVLGGLRTTNFRDTVDRVPLLGGLPIIGRVFRSTGKDHEDRELLIFLTPTVVGTLTQPEAMKLAAFDDEVARTMRNDAKSTLGRLRDKINGSGELYISVGQSGGVMSEGGLYSMEEVQTMLRETKRPASKKIILRAHPRAPQNALMALTETAMELGMKIEFDEVRMPFVPSLPDGAGAN